MPRGDGTGPAGMGSRSGRGLGPRGTQLEEAPNTVEGGGIFQRLGNQLIRGLGFSGSGQKRGLGRGGGRGMGMGSGRGMDMSREALSRGINHIASNTRLPGNPVSQPQMTRREEIAILKEQVRVLEQQIQDTKQRIGQVQKGKSHAVAHVDVQKCGGCGMCVDFCPFEAIVINNIAVIDEDKCIGCGACIDGCPFGAISVS